MRARGPPAVPVRPQAEEKPQGRPKQPDHEKPSRAATIGGLSRAPAALAWRQPDPKGQPKCAPCVSEPRATAHRAPAGGLEGVSNCHRFQRATLGG
eukprot:9038369-Alexandrium_andersonii.AAC.1